MWRRARRSGQARGQHAARQQTETGRKQPANTLPQLQLFTPLLPLPLASHPAPTSRLAAAVLQQPPRAHWGRRAA